MAHPGSVLVFTAGEAISAGEWVYIDIGDGKVYLADATDVEKLATGIALSTAAQNDSVAVQSSGEISLNSLTAGMRYYLSGDTPGAQIGTKPDTSTQYLGRAISEEKFIVEPRTYTGYIDGGYMVLPPGTTAAGTAPIKWTTQGAGLSTVEQGAMELIGNSLQFTQLAKRRGVAMSQTVITSDTTVANTTTESGALITAEHGANYLEVGKCEEIVLRGTVQQAAGSSKLQVRVKYAGTTLQTISTNTGLISAGTPFEIRVTTTVRSTGAAGTMAINSILWIDGVNNIPDSYTLATIDTTTEQNTTITLKWTVANASNIITVNQGRVLCIEPNK